MRWMPMGVAAAAALGAAGCTGDVADTAHQARTVSCASGDAPVEFAVTAQALRGARSVAALDRASSPRLLALGPGSVEAKFLVMAGNGGEAELEAIRSVLDYRGVPYDVFVAAAEPPLTADRLWSGDHGHYQATILTDSALWSDGGSTLTAAEWIVLADYEQRFGVRRVSLNTWPDPAYGFGPASAVDTTTVTLAARCTEAGAGVFRDVNCGSDHPIRHAYTYLAAAQGASLVPLLTDDAGHALAALHTGSDGRESLLLMFANNAYLPHSLTFLHGVVGWASSGTYLGDRRIDLSAQVDDIFLGSDLWGGGEYRMTDADVAAVLAWQDQVRASHPGFRLALAFNGEGAALGDPLTDALRAASAEWHWISHTFTHRVLDSVAHNVAYWELDQNREVARALGLVGFDAESVVTPRVSGLINPAAMEATLDVGIHYAVTDSSRAGCDNPSPNTAFYNAIAPQVLLMPRRPTNLFYNVSTPQEWLSEYNHIYRSYWGRDLDYAELLDRESDVLLVYLLRGETDPWMFHQANLRAYDGTHSLLGDLIDAALAKLAARVTVPVRTPAMREAGQRFAARMQYEAAGVRATLFPGRAMLIDAAAAAPVAVTGVRDADGEAYGGDRIGVVQATAGTTCVALDGGGQGCAPAPVGGVGPGVAEALPARVCDASAGEL